MEASKLHALLKQIQSGEKSPDEVLQALKYLPVKDLESAVVDTHRQLRQGHPETIFAEGKTVEQVLSIAKAMLESSDTVIATRVSSTMAESLKGSGLSHSYYETARIVVFGDSKEVPRGSKVASVAVISAGTSDLPVAEEACVTLEQYNVHVVRVYDVGVAGLHRLLSKLDDILAADLLIVVAGMDGALPSVIGGIVSSPLIAVPTSVGYGASFEGLSSLLTMLNSCAAGLTVVNIDNGFGAAMAALRIIQAVKSRETCTNNSK